MSMTQQEQADQLVESFEMFDTWEDRYRFLIDMGRKLPPLDDSQRTEEYRVHGCQSAVYLAARMREGTEDVIDFVADSDSTLVKGLIAILRKVYSGYPAQAILTFDIEGLLKRLGLDAHLSMGRRNGLFSMVQRIKTLAAQLSTSTRSVEEPVGADR